MTMIVFDGTNLVADGVHSYPIGHCSPSLSRRDVNKIIVLPKPWKWDYGSYITAIVGTGSNKHIEQLRQLIVCAAGDTNEEGEQFRMRMCKTFGTDFECSIVGVGYSDYSGSRTPKAFSIYDDGCHRELSFELGLGYWGAYYQSDKLWMQGDLKLFSGVKISDIGFKNAVEVVSVASMLGPHGVGGKLTRYNPITGKMDHPSHTNEARCLKLISKMRIAVLEEVNERFAVLSKEK